MQKLKQGWRRGVKGCEEVGGGRYGHLHSTAPLNYMKFTVYILIKIKQKHSGMSFRECTLGSAECRGNGTGGQGADKMHSRRSCTICFH